eukprot:9487883-Pyramimonas_sp.AAC.2
MMGCSIALDRARSICSSAHCPLLDIRLTYVVQDSPSTPAWRPARSCSSSAGPLRTATASSRRKAMPCSSVSFSDTIQKLTNGRLESLWVLVAFRPREPVRHDVAGLPLWVFLPLEHRTERAVAVPEGLEDGDAAEFRALLLWGAAGQKSQRPRVH